MSIEFVGTVWDADLIAPAKLVLLVIADGADPGATGVGYCWPHKGWLAYRCGMDEQSIDVVLNSLKSRGVLVPGTYKTGVHRLDSVDCFILNPAALTMLPPWSEQRSAA